MEGPTAIRAEALARSLKSTKGSFYWHFADLPTFKCDMLSLWKEKVAGEIIVEVMAEDDKRARLRVLADQAAIPAPEEFGGRHIEPAMRAWALSDPHVSSALNEIDVSRIGFIDMLLKDIGIEDPLLPQLVCAAYIGLGDLSSKGKADISASLHRLLDLVLD